MSRSTLGRLLRAPRYRERLTPDQWEHGTRMRLLILAMSIVIDVGLWLTLRSDASIDRDVLARFAVINISILGVDALISAAMLRSAALRKVWLLCVLVVFESFTFLVWVQATGTLSSYFVLGGGILIIAYRLGFDYYVAATCAVSLITLHMGVIGLELAGVLRPEALFAGDPSRVYQVTSYQWLAVSSIAGVYIMAYGAANAYINKLGEKEHALREVRKEAAQFAKGVRHGRLTGAVIADDYAVGEVLGRGGMGEIYVARRISDQTNVAVKVLHPHLLESATSIERFRREARAAERVPAQHTARILGVGTDDALGVHFIVMEYLRGEDMGALLRRRGPLRIGELLPIARQIAIALDRAHEAGVVHRDLKPSNVFLVGGNTGDTTSVDVRLLDFGISKLLDDNDDPLTRADAVLGSAGYMAPEQALSQHGAIGPATDRFSFAAVIYRALCGRVPFVGRDVASAVSALLMSTPMKPSTLHPGLSAEVDRVMEVGLARNPSDRFASATALVDELETAATTCSYADTRPDDTGLTMPTSTATAPHTPTDS